MSFVAQFAFPIEDENMRRGFGTIELRHFLGVASRERARIARSRYIIGIMPDSGGTRDTLHLYGIRGCPAAYAIRDFLQRSDVLFDWTELATDAQARQLPQVSGLHDERLPLVLFP